MSYSPNETVINKLREAGIIPVVDISSAVYDEPIREYILPGAVVGEHSAITGRPYDGYVTAEAHSELYLLKTEVLRTAISSDLNTINGFEYLVLFFIVENLIFFLVWRVDYGKQFFFGEQPAL